MHLGIPPTFRTPRLAREVRFELHRADLPERRMSAPGIVEPLDVIEDIGACIVAGRVDLAMHAFLLK